MLFFDGQNMCNTSDLVCPLGTRDNIDTPLDTLLLISMTRVETEIKTTGETSKLMASIPVDNFYRVQDERIFFVTRVNLVTQWCNFVSDNNFFMYLSST